MEFSRTKAKEAQERESHTIQQKEQIGIGQKTKIAKCYAVNANAQKARSKKQILLQIITTAYIWQEAVSIMGVF